MDAEDTMLLSKRQILVNIGLALALPCFPRMMLCSALGNDRVSDRHTIRLVLDGITGKVNPINVHIF